MKKLSGLLIAFFIVSACYGQSGKQYRIDVTIDGLKDTTLLLGYHFGSKKFVADTAQVDSNGHAVFTGDSLLPQGIYLIILPGKTYFEILVDSNQQFAVRTDTADPINHIKFTNSDENKAFIAFQRFMIEKQKKSRELSEELKQSLPKDTAKADKIRKRMNTLNDEVMDYWDKLIEQYKGQFLGSLVKSMRNITPPEPNIAKDHPKHDSLVWIHNYLFNKEHFLDNIDFSDSRLLRTPILENKLNAYFNYVLIPLPDSIIPAAIAVVERAKKNREVFQFVLSTLVNKFQTSNRMGMDGVFVALAERYYLSGEAWWASDKLIDKITERVKALKPNLIGSIAPDLWLPDPQNKYHRLSQIKAKITVVYFWDPDCSHCKKVTPEMKKIYDSYRKKGFEVYAVFTQGDQPKWMDYINKHNLNWINVWDPTFSSNFRNLYDIYSTPVMYVLDADKRIIAKRISYETLKKLLKEELE